MTFTDHRALVEKLVRMLNELDSDGLEAMCTRDFVMDWPQSGERIRGLDNLWATTIGYPGRGESGPRGEAETVRSQASDGLKLVAPACTVVSVEGGGNSGVAVWRIRYPDGSRWWAVNLYHLRDGQFDRMTGYFAPEYPAPEWRAQWVERLPG